MSRQCVNTVTLTVALCGLLVSQTNAMSRQYVNTVTLTVAVRGLLVSQSAVVDLSELLMLACVLLSAQELTSHCRRPCCHFCRHSPDNSAYKPYTLALYVTCSNK